MHSFHYGFYLDSDWRWLCRAPWTLPFIHTTLKSARSKSKAVSQYSLLDVYHSKNRSSHHPEILSMSYLSSQPGLYLKFRVSLILLLENVPCPVFQAKSINSLVVPGSIWTKLPGSWIIMERHGCHCIYAGLPESSFDDTTLLWSCFTTERAFQKLAANQSRNESSPYINTVSKSQRMGKIDFNSSSYSERQRNRTDVDFFLNRIETRLGNNQRFLFSFGSWLKRNLWDVVGVIHLM